MARNKSQDSRYKPAVSLLAFFGSQLVPWIFTHIWWQWDPDAADRFSQIYHGFNLLESAAWLAFAGLVLRRWRACRKSKFEPSYAAAFAVFGFTDTVEAWQQSTPLILFKLVNLIVLLLLRRRVMRLYLDARLF